MPNSPASLPFDIWLASKIWKAAMGFILRKDGSFNRRLADFLNRQVPASDKPVDGVRTRDVTIDEETNLWVRIFSPEETTTNPKMPVIFYIHGGFFAFLSPASAPYDKMCRKLSKDLNAVIISINYRRIPEHRYPCAIDDCFRAIKWVQSTAVEHLPTSVDLGKSFIIGDSAGGNLVHFVTCKVAEENLSPIFLRGQVLVQPSFSGEETTGAEIRLADAPFADARLSAWRWKTYLPEGADKDHPACNVFGPRARDISGLNIPKTLVIIGGYCSGQEWHAEYVDGMKAAGKQVEAKFYDEAVHGFFMFPKYKLALEYHEDVCEFIRNQISTT